MARVLVGVTGGIAAYKACELVRLLVRAGHEVLPVLTPDAERFVSRETFAALARRPVAPGDPGGSAYPHLERADLLVIAPLTANTLAKLAHGLADNVLTEAALAHDGPLVVAPAMNTRMWRHPATRANVEILRARGAELVGPDEGELAEGESGLGRMAEPAVVAQRAEHTLAAARSLAGKRVLVTAGGTREPLDAVRYLGNRSSGRMGVALAEEARRRGAAVTLLAANLATDSPPGIDVVDTPTAEDMYREALAHADADLVLMAAAVADYRPAEPRADKRPKDETPWTLELEPTRDIARTLGERRTNGQILVAFGADHGDLGLERKRRMLADKKVDLVVYNDVSRSDIGFDAADNEVVLVSARDERRVPKAPKREIAAAVLDATVELLAEAHGRDGR